MSARRSRFVAVDAGLFHRGDPMAFWKWSRTASSNAAADNTINWAEGMAPSAVNDSICQGGAGPFNASTNRLHVDWHTEYSIYGSGHRDCWCSTNLGSGNSSPTVPPAVSLMKILRVI
jgi:hypothetical protein